MSTSWWSRSLKWSGGCWNGARASYEVDSLRNRWAGLRKVLNGQMGEDQSFEGQAWALTTAEIAGTSSTPDDRLETEIISILVISVSAELSDVVLS